MLKQADHVLVIEVPAFLFRTDVRLQTFQPLEQRGTAAGRQLAAHRDIDFFNAIGNGAQHREKQILIGQHHGRMLRMVHVAFLLQLTEDLHRLSGLSYGRRDTDHFEPLRVGIACRTGKRFTRRIAFDVFPQEAAGRIVGIGHHLSGEVPAEIGPAFPAKMVEQPLLARIERIEPDKHDLVELRQNRPRVG